jgi:hypothetical protein
MEMIKENLDVACISCKLLNNEMDTMHIWEDRVKFNHVMLKGTKKNWVWIFKSESRDFHWTLVQLYLPKHDVRMEVLFCYILHSSWMNMKQKPSGRWEDNIKMYLAEISWEGVNRNEPFGCIQFEISWLAVEFSFSRRGLFQGVNISSVVLDATGNMSYAWVPLFLFWNKFFFCKENAFVLCTFGPYLKRYIKSCAHPPDTCCYLFRTL